MGVKCFTNLVHSLIHFTDLILNPLKISPKYTCTYLGWDLWEMHVIAKSNRLRRVKMQMWDRL